MATANESLNGIVGKGEGNETTSNSPIDSGDSNSTPATELSPPCSPYRNSGTPSNSRLIARKKLTTLTQEEKVGVE